MKTESTHVAGEEACVFAKYRPFFPSATLKCVGRPLYRSREARDYACLLDLDPKVSAWRCMPQPIINDLVPGSPDTTMLISLSRRSTKLCSWTSGNEMPAPSVGSPG